MCLVIGSLILANPWVAIIGALAATVAESLPVPMDDNMRELVMKEASTSVLREAARKMGMRSLRECGLLAIYDGQTSIDEVVRETLAEE